MKKRYEAPEFSVQETELAVVLTASADLDIPIDDMF